MRRIPLTIIVITAAVLGLVSCGFPVTVETQTATVSLPVSSQFATSYQEQALAIPDELDQESIQYERVRIHYAITTDSAFDAHVQIWLSEDQVENGDFDDTTDEKILDVEINDGEAISGWADTVTLRNALNAGNDFFVIGGFAESLLGGGTVTIDMYAEVTAFLQSPR